MPGSSRPGNDHRDRRRSAAPRDDSRVQPAKAVGAKLHGSPLARFHLRESSYYQGTITRSTSYTLTRDPLHQYLPLRLSVGLGIGKWSEGRYYLECACTRCVSRSSLYFSSASRPPAPRTAARPTSDPRRARVATRRQWTAFQKNPHGRAELDAKVVAEPGGCESCHGPGLAARRGRRRQDATRLRHDPQPQDA